MLKDSENCVLSPKETARILKVSRNSIYRLLRLGKLPAMKVGRQWRIFKKDLFGIRR
jgi:excisionase family DNA binding protein